MDWVYELNIGEITTPVLSMGSWKYYFLTDCKDLVVSYFVVLIDLFHLEHPSCSFIHCSLSSSSVWLSRWFYKARCNPTLSVCWFLIHVKLVCKWVYTATLCWVLIHVHSSEQALLLYIPVTVNGARAEISLRKQEHEQWDVLGSFLPGHNVVTHKSKRGTYLCMTCLKYE